MQPIRIRSIYVSVQSPGRRISIPLDARNLNQSADRVAGHAEVMLKAHLGSVFNLSRSAAHKLVCSSSRHRTGNTDLPLAANFRAGDGSIGLHHITDKSRRSE